MGERLRETGGMGPRLLAEQDRLLCFLPAQRSQVLLLADYERVRPKEREAAVVADYPLASKLIWEASDEPAGARQKHGGSVSSSRRGTLAILREGALDGGVKTTTEGSERSARGGNISTRLDGAAERSVGLEALDDLKTGINITRREGGYG